MTDQEPIKRKSTTIRTPKHEGSKFVAISRDTAQDSLLSFEARGVLFYLLSKPNDWIAQPKDIQNAGGLKPNGKPRIGRDKAEQILRELRAAGYLVVEYERDEYGKFICKTERLYEETLLSKEDREAATLKTRYPANPETGNTGDRKSSNLHIKEVVQEKEKTLDATASDAPALPVPPKPKRTPKEPKPKAPPKPREREPLFDAVALHLFGIEASDKVTIGGRIGKAKKVFVAHGVADPQTVKAFTEWYQRETKGKSPPRDPDKVEEHLLAYLATRRPAPASSNGVYRDELDRALKTILHPRTGQPLTSAQRSIARDLVTARHYDADAQLEALESILLEHVP